MCFLGTTWLWDRVGQKSQSREYGGRSLKCAAAYLVEYGRRSLIASNSKKYFPYTCHSIQNPHHWTGTPLVWTLCMYTAFGYDFFHVINYFPQDYALHKCFDPSQDILRISKQKNFKKILCIQRTEEALWE